MASAETKSWREMRTKNVVHCPYPPEDMGNWEQVTMNIMTGQYETFRPPEPDAVEPVPTPPITGYRQLSAMELELVNRVKAHAEATRILIESIEVADKDRADFEGFELDHRWLAIAKTDLQKGYMFLNRAIMRPTTF